MPKPKKSVKSVKPSARNAAAPAASAPAPGRADVARRAYDLFVRRGGEHGHDWEDWLAAERELLPEAASPSEM